MFVDAQRRRLCLLARVPRKSTRGFIMILAYERCLFEGPCRSLRRCRSESGHRTSELRDGKTQQEFRELAACRDSGVGFRVRPRDGTSCVPLRFCRVLLALGSFFLESIFIDQATLNGTRPNSP